MLRFSNISTVVLILNLLMVLLPASGPAAVLTPHHFIATAGNDVSVNEHKEMVSYINSAPADTPYLERIELRAGVDELDLNNQTYQLRFYPRAWGETRYSRKLTETAAQAEVLDRTFYLSNALKERYRLVLEYIEAVNLQDADKGLENVYIDRVNVLQRKSATEIESNISALIAAENKLVDLRLDLVDLENRIDNLGATITRLADRKADIAFDEKAIIPIDKIAALIKDLNPKPGNDNIYLKRSKFKAELSRGELELEKAKRKDYISFFQVSHSFDDKEEDWEQKTSVEIGIKLPFIKTGEEEIWRRKAELKREEFQYERKKTEAVKEAMQLLRKLKNELAQYNLLRENNKKGNAVTTLNRHMAMEGADPMDLLELKESILENGIRLSRLSFSIRFDFIELMDLMGRLTREPLIDYLSNNLEELS